MTGPAEPSGTCGTCGGPIVHVGGPSWRHVSRTRNGHVHPADPDQATRRQMQNPAA